MCCFHFFTLGLMGFLEGLSSAHASLGAVTIEWKKVSKTKIKTSAKKKGFCGFVVL